MACKIQWPVQINLAKLGRMRRETLARLACPGLEEACGGSLSITAQEEAPPGTSRLAADDVLYGELNCNVCSASFPILAGVAIVVPDVLGYVHEHFKGIAKLVPDTCVPNALQEVWLDAKAHVEEQSLEEDLESERVNALYLLTHYFKSRDDFWRVSQADPLFSELIEKYWDHGPFAKIKKIFQDHKNASLLELGCGVGGLLRELGEDVGDYLGVDSSFASIALARHIALGAPYEGDISIPEDLLAGALSRKTEIPPVDLSARVSDRVWDFIVGDALLPPLKSASWDVSASLNLLDMVPEPEQFPRLHVSLVKDGGRLIQSCPYLWHPEAAAKLRALLPASIQGSARAAEWLYEQAGTRIEKSFAHVPWLFYKHSRQLEIFSTHIFSARKIHPSDPSPRDPLP